MNMGWCGWLTSRHSDTATERWRAVTPSASTTTVGRRPLVPHQLCTYISHPSSIHIITSIRQLLKDGGLAVNYLKTVKSWVDANPNDGKSFSPSLPLVFTPRTSGDSVNRQYQQFAPITMAVDIPVSTARHCVVFA